MMGEKTYTAAQLEEIFGPGAAEHAAAFSAATAPAADETPDTPLSAIGAVASDAVSLASDVAGKNVPDAVADAVATAKDVAKAAKIFYHLYICRFVDCLKAANPIAGSWHQRGLHLAQSFARTDVLCPGCGNPMVIGRDGLDAKGNPLPDHITEDRDGNAVLHGQPIIQPAPGQEDQTAQILKENAQ